MFDPMAAGIAAMTTYEDMGITGMYSNPIFDMYDYLNGTAFEISNVAKSGIYYSMAATLKDKKYAYFEGATPGNGYTPTEPLTFKLTHGPYYIPARDNDINYGKTPQRDMILISFAGDDSQRYVDVYKSESTW